MNRFVLIAIFAVLIAFSSAFRMHSHNKNSTEPARTQVQSGVCSTILDNFLKDSTFMNEVVYIRYNLLIASRATETDEGCDYYGAHNAIWWNHQFTVHISKDSTKQSFFNTIVKDVYSDKYEVYHYVWTGNGEDTTVLKVLAGSGHTNTGTIYYTSESGTTEEELNTTM